jgi:hypothetical protein
MNIPTSTALQELASCSRSLNQASNQLSEHLTEIENCIHRFHLGVTASVNLRTYGPPDVNWNHVDDLRYDKFDGRWGLVWVSYMDEDPDNFQQKFLRDSPREIRLLAAERIPDLLSELVNEANDLASRTIESARDAEALAAALKQPIASIATVTQG